MAAVSGCGNRALVKQQQSAAERRARLRARLEAAP